MGDWFRLAVLIAKYRDKKVKQENIMLRAENAHLKIHLKSKGYVCTSCFSNPVECAGDWCRTCEVNG